MSRLETRHLEDFYDPLHRNGLSGASIRKIHWAMRQSLAWAKRGGYMTHLATEGVQLPPLNSKPITPPASEAVSKLLEVALSTDPEFGTALAFIARTGCRAAMHAASAGPTSTSSVVSVAHRSPPGSG